MTATPQIELIRVDKHYGAFHALKGIDLSIPKGQFVALVGPSGCGKSTLLRSIAGLESISGGEMRIAGDVVNNVPPRKRDLAMVFQSYALYPHMTVRKNLTYSLRLQGADTATANKAAEDVAKITGLDQLLDRYPRQLSGGQRQRVAMGRAIIRDPKAFLFDEPLSNLDAALRVHMRAEIRKLHNRLGATSVYVTHDQIEAMTMADHVVVLRDGVVEQQGAPLDLYDRPANLFVAGFIGSPAMNFVDATVREDGLSAKAALPGGPVIQLPLRVQPNEDIVLGLRPEYLKLASQSKAKLTVPLGVIEVTGSTTYLVSDTDPELMIAVQGRPDLKVGDRMPLTFDDNALHVFRRADGLALTG
ncbi:ABC transporter ATP-binding protein [Qingshengfaniella alkalisoli]|uniref:sn-glycerol-3-phosphate ABC transporter ATP-binding protein UgpC n=1 Tax=Qingshengfaniella alkalisoli TaxID=2599296 RepID=A0A5B8IYF7_9RHOB|nr:sn-glycerol-3-phosphate ABC transporter ATP-binding protein UgpC [Qingshengfaniella alkalisoli]QDY70764.1 sn-glycerol-3-phosphate ABC transporter ATP-binding protein UgpC [Qingshengfaniella alkalisoli]